MIRFLTTKRALAGIEDLIKSADRSLTLLSPYQRISEAYFDRLSAAAKRGVEITFVYGKEQMDRDQLGRLLQLPNSQIFYSERLHAKCYFNERTMVITSLNLLQTSEQNYEMGVEVTADELVYSDAVQEVDEIIAAARKDGAASKPSFGAGSGADRLNRGSVSGFCIRCVSHLPLDRYRPLCRTCYDIWSAFGNWDYTERYCHQCGVECATSMARPLCGPCFENVS